jgi:3-deoxy-D-manno-octulosonic-acid transferase
MMWLYSVALAVGLVVSSPWWIMRMLTTERYREGMRERLGSVPQRLRDAVARFAVQERVVWVHAVSVGEVLAASRLVGELEAALAASSGAEWRVVVSTTTRTGQALARERFGADGVFYFPLDFAWAVRAYMRVLRPSALVLMESELWPRMLHECRRASVPVVVVNARVSDRSFARTRKFRWICNLWLRMAGSVTLWLAQSKEDAHRLEHLGVKPWKIQTQGNLKFDIRATRQSRTAELIRKVAGERLVLVAGSTVEANGLDEEQFVLDAWKGKIRTEHEMMLVLAPRHPERFERVVSLASGYGALVVPASGLPGMAERGEPLPAADVIVLDTIGDLAAVYGVAAIAFVGGSMVPKGGHNPLEPAQFGVPIIMGTSWENFKDIVYRTGGLVTLPSDSASVLESEILSLLLQPEHMRRAGESAKGSFEEQQGATDRSVREIKNMIQTGVRP